MIRSCSTPLAVKAPAPKQKMLKNTKQSITTSLMVYEDVYEMNCMYARVFICYCINVSKYA